MDALLFIAAIACLGLVVAWYVVNERVHAKGEKGFLAIAPGERVIEAPSYREKARGPRPARSLDEASSDTGQRFTARRGGFHEKTDIGYVANGPLPRFTGRPERAPEKKED